MQDTPDSSSGKSPLAERPKETVDRERQMLELGRTMEKNGNVDGARDIYQQIAAASKGGVEGHAALARLYRNEGKLDLALAALHDARALQPQNAMLMAETGRALVASAKAQEAVMAFDEAIAADASQSSFHDGRGVALDMLGQHGAAQDSFRKALELAPGSALAQNNLALSLILSGKESEAIEILERLTAQNDAMPAMRQNLAFAYALKGDKTRALELLRRDLTPQEAEDNLRFYEFYTQDRLSGRATVMASPWQPVASAPLAASEEGEEAMEMDAPHPGASALDAQAVPLENDQPAIRPIAVANAKAQKKQRKRASLPPEDISQAPPPPPGMPLGALSPAAGLPDAASRSAFLAPRLSMPSATRRPPVMSTPDATGGFSTWKN